MTTPHSSATVGLDYYVPATKMWRLETEPVQHLLEKGTNTMLVIVSLNTQSTTPTGDPGLLDDVMCGPYNLLCGECIDGFGPTAFTSRRV